jgi:D-alanyl-D-alanine carboxypeptidase
MVKSANDVSVTIAEGLGGSVEGFAEMMNSAALRLGMRESRFVNPHGLPDDRQQTSARDMAILGRALYREFPEHRDLFQIGAIQLGRRVMANHNGLMGRYPGADGMKTGFICSSGFNVVASATRGGRRLITVVLGSPSATERTLRAADLFDRGFGSFGWGGQSLEDLPPAGQHDAAEPAPYICGGRGPVPAEEEAQAAALGGLEAGSGNSGNALASLFAPPSAMAFAAAGSGSGRPRSARSGRAPTSSPSRSGSAARPRRRSPRAREPGDKPVRSANPQDPPPAGGKAVRIGAASPAVPPAANAFAATETPSGRRAASKARSGRPAALKPTFSRRLWRSRRGQPSAKPGAVGSGGAARAKVGRHQPKPQPRRRPRPGAKPKPHRPPPRSPGDGKPTPAPKEGGRAGEAGESQARGQRTRTDPDAAGSRAARIEASDPSRSLDSGA